MTMALPRSITKNSEILYDTVSLNDDTNTITPSISSSDIDHMEGQFQPNDEILNTKVNVKERSKSNEDIIVVTVDSPSKLPTLRVKQPQTQRPTNSFNKKAIYTPVDSQENDDIETIEEEVIDIDEEDEMPDSADPSLYSPEVSRHSIEVARRRAKALELELREILFMESDGKNTTKHNVSNPSTGTKVSPIEAISIISSAFITSLSRVKRAVGRGSKYDLISTNTSPASNLRDLETDTDGLQLSPEGNGDEFINGKSKSSKTIRPALKPVSAYSTIDRDVIKPKNSSSNTTSMDEPRRSIRWHEDVLDTDEEFIEEENTIDSDTNTMITEENGSSSIGSEKKKRKKIVKNFMRRLTAREKEELYKLRPDLKIIPNWAQKYREEMNESQAGKWSPWLVGTISILVLLLLILIILILKESGAIVT